MPTQTPVYIKEVALVDFKGFRGEHKFSFVDDKGDWCRWTVFLGNNNTGKTNLLKAIASLEPTLDNGNNGKSFFPIGFGQRVISKETVLQSVFGLDIYPSKLKRVRLDEFDQDFKNQNCNIMYAYTSSSSASARGVDNEIYQNLAIYGYGIIRDIEKKGINTDEKSILNAENLFFNSKLINFEDWLSQLDYAANNASASDTIRTRAAQRRDLLQDILTSEIYPEIKDIRFTSDEQLNNYIEFQTEDGWHRLSELGYGYQATLSWMVDFCKKLFDRYPDSENPLKEPAVLLIDEIDLHLHPQWQRSIIKYLSDIFSATQFIVTTHSPFIIQSMENVNLYVLNREGDHTVEKHLGHQSFIGWKIEEILSEIMGLEDKINTDHYNTLMRLFDQALDEDNYQKGKAAYDELMRILHPQSAERKLLDIQFSQLAPDDDKA
jgi:predicted ATP-binding protein involved in virulence